MRKTADFPTARPVPLLGTMCKHFGHKITIEQTDSRAAMHFPAGLVVAEVIPTGLRLTIEAADEDAFARTRDVLISHMLRFAHREAPQEPAWRDA